jgi:hypothetical protein
MLLISSPNFIRLPMKPKRARLSAKRTRASHGPVAEKIIDDDEHVICAGKLSDE